MRYFRIYVDEGSTQPRVLNWHQLIRPGKGQGMLEYGDLGRRNYLKVELNEEIQFMDILCHPCFMVSKNFANLIRLYCPSTSFKHMILFDERNGRTVSYQVPCLPEVACLTEDSILSRNGKKIEKGILSGEKIEKQPLFKLKWARESCIIANLEFVESAYRREVMGMRIEEFMVE